VKPAEEAPSGNVEIWAAIPLLMERRVAWAPGWDRKWAEWLRAGFGLALSTTGWSGEKKRRSRPARGSEPWARAGTVTAKDRNKRRKPTAGRS
jgi:hypothetical protein